MNKSTEINAEESCVEKNIEILNTIPKRYENNLNQVMSIPITKSKNKPHKIAFMKCSDHVGASSNLQLDENARCSSCIKFALLQKLKPGVLPRNCNLTSLLMTKRAQDSSKNKNSFYQYAITEVDIS